MILRFKKEDNLKRKIVVMFIWLVALGMIINVFWDMYKMYEGTYTYLNFSFRLNINYVFNYVFAVIAFLVPIGLIFKVKISRWLILFFLYIQLVLFTLLLVVMSMASLFLPKDIYTLEFTLFTMLALMPAITSSVIYLFSNAEAQSLYGVKNFKKELKVFLSICFVVIIVLGGSFYVLDNNMKMSSSSIPILLEE